MMKQFGLGFVLVSVSSTFVLGCAGENTEETGAPAIQAAPAGEVSVALRVVYLVTGVWHDEQLPGADDRYPGSVPRES